jgi:hypothetical protein
MAQYLGTIDSPRDDALFGYGPIFGPGFNQVRPPSIFKAGFSADKKTVVFTIGDPFAPAIRRNKAQYRLYFAPIGLASPSRIVQPSIALGVFFQSTMVGSVSAPQNGGTVQISDPTFSGLDGWYYGTAVNGLGIESNPVGPVRTPIVGLNDTRIPPDVTDPTAVFTDAGFDPAGRQIIKATVTAVVPYQSSGVEATFVSNGGIGYSGDFQVTYTGGGGSGALGTAHVAGGSVDFVQMTAHGVGYTSNPIPDFSAGDGTGASGTTSISINGSLGGVQIYLNDYNQSGILVEGPLITGPKTFPTPGSTIRSDFLLLADSPPAHSVKFYFIAISQTGARTDSPALAPFVDFATGVHL